jgi:hypothetical protein
MHCAGAVSRRGYRRDGVDFLLTMAGFVALGAIALLLLGRHSIHSMRAHMPTAVGGPLKVNGPMRVRGNLYVGGPATVHGWVQARNMTIGGTIDTSLPKGELPGASGQAFTKSLAVGGPLTVQGPLIVDGSLVVGGALQSEPAQGVQ